MNYIVNVLALAKFLDMADPLEHTKIMRSIKIR